MFGADLGEGSEIYSVGPDGDDLRRLTESTGWDGEPVWSPDGARIVFVSSRAGSDDLWVMNVDGSEPVRLTNFEGDEAGPAWSPDGSSVVFTSDRDTHRTLNAARSLFRLDIDQGVTIELADDLVAGGNATWSPDGSTIVFAGRCSSCDRYQMVAVPAAGGERSVLADVEGHVSDPEFSPDGSRLVFLEHGTDGDVGGAQLRLLTVATGEIETVPVSIGGALAPTWSPDGSELVLGGYRCSPLVLCRVFLDPEAGYGPGTVLRSPRAEIPDGQVAHEHDWRVDGLRMRSPDWGCCVLAAGEPVAAGPVSVGRAGRGGVGRTVGTLPVTNNATGVSVESALWGGGFINALAAGPDAYGTNTEDWVYAVGDNSGTHRIDLNDSGPWENRNAGFSNFLLSRQIAAVAVHPDDPDLVYTASNGGFYVSDDGGASWVRESPAGLWNGNNPGPGLIVPEKQPRSSGRMIVVDYDSGRTPPTILYSGTFDDGVHRSTDGGQNWTRVALQDHYVRSLIQLSNGELLAASYGTAGGGNTAGIWRLDGCDSGTCSTKDRVGATSSVDTPEELVQDSSGDVWCACGFDGVMTATPSAATSWSWSAWGTVQGAGANNGDFLWSSIDVGLFDDNATDDVVVGAVNDALTSDARTLRWSSTSSASWSSVLNSTTKSALRGEPVCNKARQYWLAQTDNAENISPGYNQWDTGHVEFYRGDLYFSGRAGVYRVEDSDADGHVKDQVDAEEMCALVEQLASAAARAVDTGDTNRQLIVGTTDFDSMGTVNDLVNVESHVIGSQLTVAWDVDFDRKGEFAVVGAGKRDTADEGGVYEVSALDATTTSNLSSPINERVLGIEAATRGGVSYTLAAIHGSGVHRLVDGTWDSGKVLDDLDDPDFMDSGDDDRVQMVWATSHTVGSNYRPYVYLLDKPTGLWRSDTNGADGSWDLVWAPDAGDFPDSSGNFDNYIGFIAVDPNDSDVVFVSADSRLVRIEGALTCTESASNCTLTEVNSSNTSGFPAKLGPIAFDPDPGTGSPGDPGYEADYVLIASRVEDSTTDPAELWRCEDSGSGCTVVVGTTDEVWAGNAFLLTDMTVTPANTTTSTKSRVFVASQGLGVLVVWGAVPLP